MNVQKVIYFCDPLLTEDIDSEQQEYEETIAKRLMLDGIEFKNVNCTTNSAVIDEMCDVFFFDWGGMSLGNSCLESFSRLILRQACDRPNTYYVMVSLFTQRAMEDAIEDFGESKPVNLLLNLNDFIGLFKKLEMT